MAYYGPEAPPAPLTSAQLANSALVLASTTTGTAVQNSSGFSVGGNYMSPFSMRNKIINGAMMIDQRNAGASVTQPASVLYCVDRFYVIGSLSSKFTAIQSSSAPTGFTSSLLLTSSSSYSVLTGDYFLLRQLIEGLNIADLDYGLSTAKTCTLSFWVKSSLTGTFGGSVGNSAGNRLYPYSYTIIAANTWELKTVIIPGDTTGTWLTTNGTGIVLGWSMGMGTTYKSTPGAWGSSVYLSATGETSLVGTSGATLYITGVQFEIGSVATPFERRSFGLELALCQRYYNKSFDYSTAPVDSAAGYWSTIVNGYGGAGWTPHILFPVEMRTPPTIVIYRPSTFGATAGQWAIYLSGGWASLTATSPGSVTTRGFFVSASHGSLAAGTAYIGAGHWTASAEL
jgi:hypothetical protein